MPSPLETNVGRPVAPYLDLISETLTLVSLAGHSNALPLLVCTMRAVGVQGSEVNHSSWKVVSTLVCD